MANAVAGLISSSRWRLRRSLAASTHASMSLSRCRFMSTDLSNFGNVLGAEKISPQSRMTFGAWHEAVEQAMLGKAGDPMAVLEPHVDDDVVFHPPTYYKSWEGKDEFLLLMNGVSKVFGSSFTYGRQWVSPEGADWALEFTAVIGKEKRSVQGIDLVRLDEETGKIVDFKVLARPPNAVDILKREMMKQVGVPLAKMKAKKALSSLF